jgi:tetrahydromethanopterin S-methyltransferase subunit C
MTRETVSVTVASIVVLVMAAVIFQLITVSAPEFVPMQLPTLGTS